MKNFAKAKEYYKKRTELEPNSPEPFYSIGNVNWILCYNKQDPLPTDQKKVLIEEGLTNLEKAVQNDPNYYNAYFYINLLLRQKAQVIIDELTDANPKLKDQFAMAALDPKSLDPLVKKHAGSRYEDYQGYLKKADENFEKAMQIRKEVEAKAETKGLLIRRSRVSRHFATVCKPLEMKSQEAFLLSLASVWKPGQLRRTAHNAARRRRVGSLE